jgi:ubiquitin-conjugating enzyme E2 D/E
MLNDGWSPQLKLAEVLLMVNQLLKEPNPENPLEPEIANLYKADRNAFNKQAKEWTKKCVVY